MIIFQAGGSLTTWGGIERYICYLAGGLKARGSSVVIGCRKEAPLGVRAPVETVSVRTPLRARMSAVPAYARAFRSRQFDVAHAHYSPDFIPMAIAAKAAKVPRIVMTRHLAIPWGGAKARLMARLYDRIICVSDAVKQSLLGCGIPSEKLEVVKMGLPGLNPSLSREESRLRWNMGPDAFVAGFVGRLTVEKGAAVLLEAVAHISDIECHLFGDGPQREELVRLSEQLQIGNRVAFHGMLTDVSDAIYSLDALVAPSEWNEAFPAVVLEAMSLGVPVVGSKIGGIPEQIQDGSNGLLAQPGSPESIAEKIELLRNDPAFARKIGNAGKATHANLFTVERMAERFENCYLSIDAAR